MIRRAVPVALACAVGATGAAGCQTTQETSRAKAAKAKGLAKVTRFSVGTPNRDVAVGRTAVLRDANGVAAVVELRNTGRAAQAKVPVAITLRDRGGKTVYSNTIGGLDESLVSMPLLRRGERAFWVNNQILATGRPTRLRAQVGAAKAQAPAAGALPQLVISGARLRHDDSGVYLTGRIENRSKVAQRRVVVYGVARRGGRVVAAGRAVVDRLAPAPQPKPTSFRIFFIGNPSGAQLTLSAPPTVLR